MLAGQIPKSALCPKVIWEDIPTMESKVDSSASVENIEIERIEVEPRSCDNSGSEVSVSTSSATSATHRDDPECEYECDPISSANSRASKKRKLMSKPTSASESASASDTQIALETSSANAVPVRSSPSSPPPPTNSVVADSMSPNYVEKLPSVRKLDSTAAVLDTLPSVGKPIVLDHMTRDGVIVVRGYRKHDHRAKPPSTSSSLSGAAKQRKQSEHPAEINQSSQNICEGQNLSDCGQERLPKSVHHLLTSPCAQSKSPLALQTNPFRHPMPASGRNSSTTNSSLPSPPSCVFPRSADLSAVQYPPPSTFPRSTNGVATRHSSTPTASPVSTLSSIPALSSHDKSDHRLPRSRSRSDSASPTIIGRKRPPPPPPPPPLMVPNNSQLSTSKKSLALAPSPKGNLRAKALSDASKNRQEPHIPAKKRRKTGGGGARGPAIIGRTSSPPDIAASSSSPISVLSSSPQENGEIPSVCLYSFACLFFPCVVTRHEVLHCSGWSNTSRRRNDVVETQWRLNQRCNIFCPVLYNVDQFTTKAFLPSLPKFDELCRTHVRPRRCKTLFCVCIMRDSSGM